MDHVILAAVVGKESKSVTLYEATWVARLRDGIDACHFVACLEIAECRTSHATEEVQNPHGTASLDTPVAPSEPRWDVYPLFAYGAWGYAVIMALWRFGCSEALSTIHRSDECQVVERLILGIILTDDG